MSSLRNILRTCSRKTCSRNGCASIPGSTPLQIQCTFNPVYSAYPTSISRQAYSSDANEAPENGNDPVNSRKSRSKITVPEDQKTDSIKSQPRIPGNVPAEDQKTSKAPTFNKSDSMKSSPNVTEDQRSAKTPTFNKKLNFRKYYIGINRMSKKTTPESLREFYSQFGEIAYCNIIFKGKRNEFGSVAFSSREAMDRALNSLPHCIDGKEIHNVRPGLLSRNQLTLQVTDLSLKTTTESLKEFYSRFGRLNDCWIKKAKTNSSKFGEVTFSNQKDMHRALDAQPHIIDGSEVFLQYATFDLDLFIRDVPENITEQTLLAFYSKYGQLRQCRHFKGTTGMSNVFVSYSAIDEVNRAMDDRPHIINGRPMKIKLNGKDHLTPVSLFVGSLPENVTEETLREEFSKYGKPVYWDLKNDGCFNQSGPYGIVAYGTEQEALNALNSGPHTIEGAVVDVRRIEFLGRGHIVPVSLALDLFQKTSPKRHCARNSPNMESSFSGKWKIYWDLKNDGQFNQSGLYGFVAYASEQERCARKASVKSIPGGTPLQVLCTFNPVYSAYPTSISRQAYSSDANEAPKNEIDPVQKYFLEVMKSRKSRPKITVPEEQKASKSFTADSAQKTPFGQTDSIKSHSRIPGNVPAEDQNASTAPTFNKSDSMKSSPNIKYYIAINGLSKDTTPESLREFYSQFGEIAVCNILFPGQRNEFGNVAFLKEEAMDRALNSLPHCIDGTEIKNVYSAMLGKKQLTLQIDSIKSPTNVTKDQKVSKIRTFNKTDSTNSRPNIKTWPNVTEAQTPPKTPTFNNNLNLRKYYINIRGLSNETTEDSLREFYSQFGEIAVCTIITERNEFGSVAFTSRIAMDRALNSLPHCIDGKVIEKVGPSTLGKKQRTLKVLDLSPKTTIESLKEFYSKFGPLNAYYVDERINGKVGKVTFAFQKDMHLALDAQPHIIDGSEVFLKYATFDLDLQIRDVPGSVTEDALRTFYSKYGQLRRCLLQKGKTGIPDAYVSYSAIDEVNRAMADRPHVIDGKPLKIEFLGKGLDAPVSLVIGSLPENVTEETLRKEFSKYGKLVLWELQNDGRFNQSRTYGLVSYASEQEALNALNSGPHTIDGAVVDRCASRNSILGSTPLQIQCTFNPVYSAYPTSISRQAYSSDANEAPKNDPVRKYILEMMNANKVPSNVSKDQKASKDQKTSKFPTFNKNLNLQKSFGQMNSKKPPPNIVPKAKKEPNSPTFNKTNSIKSQPNVAKDQKARKAPIFNKKLNFRKYYIGINGLSNETTPESLREFYSQFGEIAFCAILFPGEQKQYGSVAFTSRKAVGYFALWTLTQKFASNEVEMNRALNSLPHCIDGKEIKTVRPGSLGRKQLTLYVLDLSPKTTFESLKAFYSKFGWLNGCWIKKASTGIGQVGEVTFSNQKNMHRALDAQPHVIDGSEVFLKYSTHELDFLLFFLPENITEQALVAFYSKYGQLRECRLHKGKTGISHAFVSYSAIDELNRAMEDRPHVIDGKPLEMKFLGRSRFTSVHLFVGSLPENVTEETLREEFSKYGKPVYWKLKNDGHFNQSGPYGIVAYSSEQEALKVLNSGPHTIEGAILDVRIAKEANEDQKSESTGISRQAYSSDANESPKNATESVQKLPLGQLNSKNYPTNVPEDQKSESTGISRQAYSSDATVAPKNATDSVQKTPFGQTNAKKSSPNVAKDQEALKSQNTAPKNATVSKTNSVNFRTKTVEDQKPSNAPIFNKNLNLRKYYINIRGLSNETTEESLREFYSQFGEIAFCSIIFPGYRNEFGSIAFTSRIAMDRALNSLPHCIDVKEIHNVRPAVLGKKQLTLHVIDLSPKTTYGSLKAFYSRFGRLNNCFIKKANVGQFGEVTFSNQEDMHRALDAQPHVIDGSEVFLQYATFDLDFEIDDLPEFITEEDLIAFYSKYGQLRDCCVLKGKTGVANAFVSYSAVDEVNRAMADRPHIIDGKPLEIKFIGKGHSVPVSLFVGSLPENVTEETLREEFSKYGKLVVWELINDGRFNQSGPYGIVTFASEQEALNALNRGPHTIKGSVVDVRKAKEAKTSSSKQKCTFNPVCLDPTSISRQAYSSDANEAPKNVIDPVQMYILEMMNANKIPSNVSKDQEASKDQNTTNVPTFSNTDSMKSPPNILYSSTKSQKTSKFPTFNKNLNLQKSFGQMYSKNYPTNVPANQKSESTGISRQAYSSDANEAPKNATDSAQKTPFGQTNAKKSSPNVAKDQEASKSQNTAKSPTFNKTDSIKSPNFTEDQKPSKAPIFNKNLNLRKYYISINGLSINTTPESLREFYSQFGEIAFCAVMFPGERKQFGSVAFSSREAMDRALNSLPHCIDGKEIKDVEPAAIGRKQLTLRVLDLSPKTTTESLKEFYSKFGMLNDCWIRRADTGMGKIGEVIFQNEKPMHRALDAQPHIIDGSEVFLQYATYDLDFWIRDVAKSITEEDLIAFYSKYGQLRECRLQKTPTGLVHAFVSYSAVDEINRAMDDRPHIIGGEPLRISFLGRGHSNSVSLVVGSLPENVTEETLRKEFSKYGKPVYWKIENEGRFNQSGPYGIVTYGSEEEALNALNSGPHTIEGSVVDVRKVNEAKTSSSKQKSYN
ncbi:RNA recognition motif domain-containing protein [Ditylenchus destructor]|nr:RNA recognition motif domain-containing protein [Ditylenchus destructor]